MSALDDGRAGRGLEVFVATVSHFLPFAAAQQIISGSPLLKIHLAAGIQTRPASESLPQLLIGKAKEALFFITG